MVKKKQKDKKATKDPKDTRIVIKLPEKLEIVLASASELHYYELFQWLIIILLPVASGFWTAYVTSSKNGALLWSAVIFSIISAVFMVIAFVLRRKVFTHSINKTANFGDFEDLSSEDT